jgi:hypothetical protein
MRTYTFSFPTPFHRDAATIVRDYFSKVHHTDTILLVNSLARGQGVPESDLDMVILVHHGTNVSVMSDMINDWTTFSKNQSVIQNYLKLHPFAHLHIDIINGEFNPGVIEVAEPINYFEVEVGNRVCYAAPLGNAGPHFLGLTEKWLPYYNDELRWQRLSASIDACKYSLSYIVALVNRGLYFHAVEILFKALQQYLQSLFIAKSFYPISYNKWIKEQLVNMLDMPELYEKLPPILSITNIESDEPANKSHIIRHLLEKLEQEFL